MSKIHILTADQRFLIPQYLEKWRTIAVSTQRLEVQSATDAIAMLYAELGIAQPEIVVCESPVAVNKAFTKLLKRQLIEEMQWLVERYSEDERSRFLGDVLGESLQSKINQL